MDFNFYLPVNILFGRGKAELIGSETAKYGTHALLVTGRGSTKKSGLLDRALSLLEKSGVKVTVFDKVTQNPLTTTVAEGAELAKTEKCDVILGIGGGSIMDAAKAIAFSAVNEGNISDYIYGRKTGTGALPMVLVPTTCGTGSEGNGIAVLTDPDTKDKKALANCYCIARASIVDPELMTTMPKSVLSSVGFDAFTHSLEAYTGNRLNPISEALSYKAMGMLAEHLPKLVKDNDKASESWDAVSLASTFGGMVIFMSGVSAAHAMEHPASGLKDIVHGRGLAALTPHIVERQAKYRPEKFAEVSRLLGGTGAEDCADLIRRFLHDIELEVTLGDLGITSEDVDWMAENCLKTAPGNLANSPVQLSIDDLKEIYTRAIG